ncbi:hypothetical protein [Mycobacterium colombiense]|uniref:hypothetical protein n=1 Tax=Mycobacterium colombiense TaxID=339268 RepID=UPI0015C142C6|nr:hypothetical protein [Mycobacterium colombiense]
MQVDESPTGYPDSWKPAHVQRAEALALSVDSYVAALSAEEFDELVARTRPAGSH